MTADASGSNASGTEWQVTEEFGHRLGCGLVTAVILPVWFGVLLVAAGGEGLATAAGLLFFVAAVLGGVVGWRRIRSLPRSIRLAEDGTLSFRSARGETVRHVRDLREVRLDSSLGIKPVRLGFATGRPIRVSREFEDLDGLLAALRARAPDVAVVERDGAR